MKTEKHNKKKEQGAETKKRLYESAEQLFIKYNYTDVSVEAITEAAGVTKGTFYVHYDSKDELYISLFADYASRMDAEYKAFFKNLPSDMSASDVLLAVVEKIVDVNICTVGYDRMKTFYTLQLTRVVSTESVNGSDRELYTIIEELLDRGIKRGEFKKSLSSHTLTKQVVMAIRGLTYEWCIRYPDFNFKEEILQYFKLLLDGIRA
ncbi:TetR/AcrR family transcriptional regulator [Acetanaerobacterium elongatum]|uniref:Transcriptional regulator, TetR family n=1 Tax=Acetanaerobacterium elongatum TaxID=258515 RepID=A0A1H0FSH9_9FIRM|nr:TetR/AcrR family transcriptional regulator [Acetanaerobacterium elongatum]SDN97512.1 transcriptional regulator, TetR family [Acetanaerobacterium elongatum]